MDIAIPDMIQFYTEEKRSKEWTWQQYCFPHAVLRALEGEKIKTKLASEEIRWCDDCNNFGDPNSHDLASLRRVKR